MIDDVLSDFEGWLIITAVIIIIAALVWVDHRSNRRAAEEIKRQDQMKADLDNEIKEWDD